MVAQSAKIEAGHVQLPCEADWLDTLLLEMLGFPQGRHDDQVDSVSQFLKWASSRAYCDDDVGAVWSMRPTLPTATIGEIGSASQGWMVRRGAKMMIKEAEDAFRAGHHHPSRKPKSFWSRSLVGRGSLDPGAALVWNSLFGGPLLLIGKNGRWCHERNYLFSRSHCGDRRSPLVFWLEVSQRPDLLQRLSQPCGV
jgi:hypothetical protein